MFVMALIFAGLGGILLGNAAYWWLRARRVEGELLGVRQDGGTFHSVFRYQWAGQSYEATSNQGSSSLRGRDTGDRVPLLIMPGDFTVAVEARSHVWTLVGAVSAAVSQPSAARQYPNPCYCTETTRSSRERPVGGRPVCGAARVTSIRSNKGSSTTSSMMPRNGIAKFKGSKAKTANAIEAGISQRGRLGCLSAFHKAPRSRALSRQSRKSRGITVPR